jgi:hypothetical protein
MIAADGITTKFKQLLASSAERADLTMQRERRYSSPPYRFTRQAHAGPEAKCASSMFLTNRI